MIKLSTAVILVLLPLVFFTQGLNAQSSGEPRQFTAREIEIAYQYQEQFGQRIPHPIKTWDCFMRKSDIVARYQGKEISVPCRFVLESWRQLKEILEKGAAKYLFPLDAGHAHLAVPVEIWKNKYRAMPGDELLPALLRDPALAAVYHTAERLTPIERGTGKLNPGAIAWQKKRNVLGFYDGRPVVILLSQSTAVGVTEPENYRFAGEFYFLAHRLGEMVFSVGGKQIIFDLSFVDVGSMGAP